MRSGPARSRRRTLPRSRRRTSAGSRFDTRSATVCESQHLPAVSRGHDARRAVHGGAEKVVVAALDDARMHPAASTELQASLRCRRAERTLELEAGAKRVAGIVEDGVHSVARHLHERAVVARDDRARERVVTRKRGRHQIGRLLPQSRAVLDVGEQESRDGRGRVHGGLGTTATPRSLPYDSAAVSPLGATQARWRESTSRASVSR